LARERPMRSHTHCTDEEYGTAVSRAGRLNHRAYRQHHTAAQYSVQFESQWEARCAARWSSNRVDISKLGGRAVRCTHFLRLLHCDPELFAAASCAYGNTGPADTAQRQTHNCSVAACMTRVQTSSAPPRQSTEFLPLLQRGSRRSESCRRVRIAAEGRGIGRDDLCRCDTVDDSAAAHSSSSIVFCAASLLPRRSDAGAFRRRTRRAWVGGAGGARTKCGASCRRRCRAWSHNGSFDLRGELRRHHISLIGPKDNNLQNISLQNTVSRFKNASVPTNLTPPASTTVSSAPTSAQL
jgi:hypothetical protein